MSPSADPSPSEGTSSAVYREAPASFTPRAAPFRAIGVAGGRPSPFFTILGAVSLIVLAVGPNNGWIAGAQTDRGLLFFVLPMLGMAGWYLLFVVQALRLLSLGGEGGVLYGLSGRAYVHAVVAGRSRLLVESDRGSQSLWLLGGGSAEQRVARAAAALLPVAEAIAPAPATRFVAPPSATWSAGGSALGWLLAIACSLLWLAAFSSHQLPNRWFFDGSPLNDLYNTLDGSTRATSHMLSVAFGICGAPIVFLLLHVIFSRLGRPLDREGPRMLFIVACETSWDGSPKPTAPDHDGLWRNWTPWHGVLLAAPFVLILATPLLYLALMIPPLVNLLIPLFALYLFGICVRRLASARIIVSTATNVRVRLDGQWQDVDECRSSGDFLLLMLGRVPISLAFPRLGRLGPRIPEREDEMAALGCYLQQNIENGR